MLDDFGIPTVADWIEIKRIQRIWLWRSLCSRLLPLPRSSISHPHRRISSYVGFPKISLLGFYKGAPIHFILWASMEGGGRRSIDIDGYCANMDESLGALKDEICKGYRTLVPYDWQRKVINVQSQFPRRWWTGGQF